MLTPSHLKQKIILGVLCCALIPTGVQAEGLRTIFQTALREDPVLQEARANVAIAGSQVKISEAGHHPIISLNNTGVVAQNHKNSDNRRSGPTLTGQFNLYSWGAVDAEIERDRHKQDYYIYKYYETREQLGKSIGELYLTALRAKENITIYEESIQRHQKIVNDLKIVVSYDRGRNFELNEALSRMNQVESVKVSYERQLQLALSKLNRYTSKIMTADDLTDPFSGVEAGQFVSDNLNPDIKTLPTYLAQQKELDSTHSSLTAAKARRLPAINLHGSANRDSNEIYVTLSLDLYNPGTKYAERQSYYSWEAAQAKMKEIELEVAEQARSSELSMRRNQELEKIASAQVGLQRNVVRDAELQFKIATRSLLSLLDAYKELTSVQATEVAARNDFREAALAYLVSQARVAAWAGVGNVNF